MPHTKKDNMPHTKKGHKAHKDGQIDPSGHGPAHAHYLAPSSEPTPATNNDIEVGIEATVLDARDDPFAPRDGKTLLWRNINMTLVR
jgi:hypothetical protein